MRSSLSAAAVLLSAVKLVSAQTFTECNPTEKTCPSNPGLGGTVTTDFTAGDSDQWTLADGTTMSYDKSNGATFSIAKSTQAPTMGFSKYIMFGKVSVVMQASPGAGIVSSFILESADLDEIDWEWLGSVDSQAQSNFFGKGNTTSYDRGAIHDMSSAVTGFHTYEIDWTKDSITWSIDGASVRTLPYSSPLAVGGKNYPQTPMKVKMGSWVGCASEAATTDPKTQGTCEWAGGAADFSAAPFNMLVKSVTIQDYGCGGDYTYTDMSGSYQSIKSSGTCNGQADTDAVSSSESIPAITGSATGSVTSTGSSVSTSLATSSSSASSSISSSASSSSASGSTHPSSAKAAAINTPSGSTPSASAHSTTLATASSGTAASPVPTTTAGAPASVQTANAAGKQSRYGYLDLSVVALGLGFGYFVM